MIGWNREKPLKTLLLKWFYLDAFYFKTLRMNDFYSD